MWGAPAQEQDDAEPWTAPPSRYLSALSKKPEELICKELAALRDKDQLTPALVFCDPYMLDFLELADTYSEKDLESAILREIEHFLLELGAGFAFVERQKRIVPRH